MQIEVSVDSGANVHSTNTNYIELDDLGVDLETWLTLSDVQKAEYVLDYWQQQGLPTYTWRLMPPE